MREPVKVGFVWKIWYNIAWSYENFGTGVDLCSACRLTLQCLSSLLGCASCPQCSVTPVHHRTLACLPPATNTYPSITTQSTHLHNHTNTFAPPPPVLSPATANTTTHCHSLAQPLWHTTDRLRNLCYLLPITITTLIAASITTTLIITFDNLYMLLSLKLLSES